MVIVTLASKDRYCFDKGQNTTVNAGTRYSCVCGICAWKVHSLPGARVLMGLALKSIHYTPNHMAFLTMTLLPKWWAISIPKDLNPFDYTTGKDCALKQIGPTWFLVGIYGASSYSYLYYTSWKNEKALINAECDYLPELSLTQADHLLFHAILYTSLVISLGYCWMWSFFLNSEICYKPNISSVYFILHWRFPSPNA